MDMGKKVFMGISALMTVCLLGCKEYDISQKFSKDTKYADKFIDTFGQPDPNHDWSMVTQASVTVRFGEDELVDDCTISVYNTDPYAKTARVLASSPVSGREMTLSFEVSKDCVAPYVVLMRADGFFSYKSALIQDGKCDVSFGIDEPLPDEPAAETRARGSFDTQSASAISFWDGKVPDGQYTKFVPQDAVEFSGTVNEVNSNSHPGTQNVVLKDASVNSTNFWSGNVNIYISGSVSVNNWYCGGNSNIYLLPGATLSLPYYTSSSQWNTIWTVCSNANLVFGNVFEFAYGQKVYNAGTVQGPGFNLSNDCLFVNQGTLSADNDIALKNGSSILVNYGSMSGNNFGTEGSSQFYNDGYASFRGTSLINSNNSTWYNRGHFVSKDFIFNSNSGNWLNECSLKVTNELNIVLGDGSPLPVNNSYIEAASMYMNTGGISLGANAQLVVIGTATVNNNPYTQWKKRGIESTASGDSWAVFKAGRVVQEDRYQGYSMSYAGNLIIDCNDHFAQGYSGQYPYIQYAGKAKMAPGGDQYTIPGDDCSEPYGGGSEAPTRPTQDPQSWILACEDLGSTDDYDFNDVVLSVSHLSGESTARIRALAAGGVLASIVYFDDVPANGSVIDSEVHNLLGGYSTDFSGSFSMLNTQRRHSQDYYGSPVYVSVSPDASVSDIVSRLSIRVVDWDEDLTSGSIKYAHIVNKPTAGAAPQMIIVPDSWIWPVEKRSIKAAYPGFSNWVKDASIYDWSSSAVNDNLVEDY